MTDLLEKVISKIERMPSEKQDELAVWIMEELKSEERWQSTFNETSEELSVLAEVALEEYNAGNAEELDPDDL